MTYDSIWDDPQKWPSRDPAGYVFLARAVNAVGKALFPDGWTGSEVPTPRPYMSHGCLVIDVLSESEKQATARFDKVQDTIATAAETGTLVTAAREVGGGKISPLPAQDWSSERLAHRFSTCLLDPSDPFGRGGFLTHWIYVHSDSLTHLVEGLGGTPDFAAPTSPSSRERRKPGRRPSLNWKRIEQITRLVHANMERMGGYDSIPGATQEALISAVRKAVKSDNLQAPSRSALQQKMPDWGL